MEEKEVVLLLDRFGYGKVLEKAIYERNREVADRENRIVLPCMNTDKLCIFTQTGLMHQMKVQDIPAGRLRDKGVPLDNVANYDSRTEQILRIIPASELPECKLLFVTAGAMVKLVEGKEFCVQKKTVAATKLAENDTLKAVIPLTETVIEEGEQIVMQSEDGYFLRFALSEITTKKKTAIGIRGMSLKDEDRLRKVYLTRAGDGESVLYKEKELYFQKIKLMSRDSRGVKVRR